jgi:intracellular septation protein
MQMLFEFLPIIVFFAVYKLNGIYAATAAAIIISILQVTIFWIKHKRVDRIQLGMMIMIAGLGTATLIFRKPIFIKWKPTVINWLFALLFFVTQYVGKQPLIEMMFQGKVQLPDAIWRKLNFLWIGFFSFVGFANIYVAYHYSTNTWVNFKLFGVLGLTVIFIIAQAFYLAKHVREP